MSVAQYVILILSKTKLDSTFPSIRFLINGFSVPHGLDRNSKGSGILFYVGDKIIVLPLNRYSLPLFHRILSFYFFESKMACMLFLQSAQKLKEHLQVFSEGIQLYKRKWEEEKSRSGRKVSKKQLIEESDDNDAVIGNVGGNNSTDDLSEPDDEMETGSINDNFRNAFYFAARINLHTFLVEQVASVLSMS